MATIAVAAFSIHSVDCYCSQTSISKSKPLSMQFTSPNYLWSFSGLKAAVSVSYEMDMSFLGKENNAALQASLASKARKQSQRVYNYLQPRASSFKVAVLGAAGGIGQPLALLIKTSPLVSSLQYSIAGFGFHRTF